MNCCTIGLIVFFRVLFHIAALDSVSPVILFMAVRVSCKFLSVVFLASCCFRSRMPLYAVACVKVESFAPCISSSLVMSRFRRSGCRLFAPCFASASLPSFPSFPTPLSLLPSLSLSVSRFHSCIQGSMLSCHVVLIVPPHFQTTKDPDTINHPIYVICPLLGHSIIFSTLSLSMEPTYPLDQSLQSFTLPSRIPI
jgi:hypothetical protein